MYKQFLTFCYDQYYPVGGMNDFVSSADSHEEAYAVLKEKYKKSSFDYGQIVDLKTGIITDVSYREFLGQV